MSAIHNHLWQGIQTQHVRLTLVIHSLRMGGAERVMTMLANHWARRGWEVTLLTLEPGEPFFRLDPAVVHRPLDLAAASASTVQAVRNGVRRLGVLRGAIAHSRPDLVLSFIDSTNVLTLLATAGLGVPVVVSERSDPARRPIGRAWAQLRRLTYPFAACLVAQTGAAAAYFGPLVRKAVIPNPLAAPTASAHPRSRRIVAMGRLVACKGYDRLIDAFAAVAGAHPDWSLVIWGEGPERPALEARRDALGLHDRIQLPGMATDPYARLAEGSVFALSSHYEGFPNALCEAMAAGLACVGLAGLGGTAELVHHEEDGLLVDAADLAGALERLMGDEALRARLGGNARHLATRLAEPAVLARWDETFAAASPRFTRA